MGHDWSQLPQDVLQTIISKLSGLVDIIRLCLVCKWWQFVGASEADALHQHPLIMLPPEGNCNSRLFYDPADQSVHRLRLPKLRGTRTYGSSQGWMFVADKFGLRLINPWSKEVVSGLPSLIELGCRYPIETQWFVCKAVPSAPPSSGGHGDDQSCVVALIYGKYKQLAFANLNDEVWRRSVVEQNFDLDDKLQFDDVIYFENLFFAISTYGHIVTCCNFHDQYPKLISKGILNESIVENMNLAAWKKYLVYSEGELWAVLRKLELISGKGGYRTSYRTKRFRVFRVMFDCHEGLHVEEMNNLQGHALFLGINASIAFPPSGGYRANCIYFTDDFVPTQFEFWGARRGDDVGVFNMEDGTVSSLGRNSSKTRSCPPIWVSPPTIHKPNSVLGKRKYIDSCI